MEVVEDETNTWVVSGSVDGTIRKWNGHTGMVGVSKPDVNPIRCSLDLAGWWRLECWRQHHTMSHETPFGVNPTPPSSLFPFQLLVRSPPHLSTFPLPIRRAVADAARPAVDLVPSGGGAVCVLGVQGRDGAPVELLHRRPHSRIRHGGQGWAGLSFCFTVVVHLFALKVKSGKRGKRG